MAAKTLESTADTVHELRELEDVRRQAIARMERAVSASSKILTSADVAALRDSVISDKAFAAIGITDTRKKIEMVQQNIAEYIPKIERESMKLADEFERKIKDAEKNGWISAQSAKRWLEKRLGGSHAKYWDKKKFIELDMEKFPSYYANWKRVGEEAKKLREHKEFKSVTAADVGQIGVFRNEKQFLNLSFEAREALVKTVHAAVLAKEKRMPQLFAKAKAMLEGAAQRQALSWNKVGTWLERIFKSNAKPELIEKFLNNEGSSPLQTLIDNWSAASKGFQSLEAKRKALGTPPGFHFVKMDVFLNWRYEQRTSYLAEAGHRFRDIDKEDELFLKIQHELGAKDWEAAEDLIEKAEGKKWSEEDGKKLQSMKKFLREHRSQQKDKEQQKGEAKSPKEMLAKMQGLVDQLPPFLRRTYIAALSRGYQAFWVLTTLMYNRVWCHQHNFLDTGKEKRIEEKARVETLERIEKGHTKFGHEANVVKGRSRSRAAVRDQAGVKGAQILFTDERSTETIIDEIEEQKNDRQFWYWTSMIPEGVQYPEHLYIVQSINPQMKRLARKMEDLGIRYPLSGKVEDAVVPDHVIEAKK